MPTQKSLMAREEVNLFGFFFFSRKYSSKRRAKGTGSAQAVFPRGQNSNGPRFLDAHRLALSSAAAPGSPTAVVDLTPVPVVLASKIQESQVQQSLLVRYHSGGRGEMNCPGESAPQGQEMGEY